MQLLDKNMNLARTVSAMYQLADNDIALLETKVKILQESSLPIT